MITDSLKFLRIPYRELNLGIPLLIEHPDAVKIEVKYSSAYIDLYGITVYVSVGNYFRLMIQHPILL